VSGSSGDSASTGGRGRPAVAGRSWVVRYTDHLVGLLVRCESASARIAGADPDRRAEHQRAARTQSARHSARLDASPLTDETADAVDARLAAGEPVLPDAATTSERADEPRGWGRALKLEGLPTQDVAAIEYANLLREFDEEPALADEVFDRPPEVLRTLHGLVSDGLVAPEVCGRLRRTEQAMHDGAQGRVVYHAPPPSRLPELMGELEGWLGERSALLPAVVAAGVVHERILEWQPFEAANGRVARAASRVVLRARGIDPHGLAVIDAELARDALGYYTEIAATMRRRGDLAPWIERWSEAACRALERAADELAPAPAPTVPARAAAVVGALAPGGAITVTEYAERAAVRREIAMRDLRVLERAGVLEPIPGTGGLRWRREEKVPRVSP
jgi:Fic family protein